MKTSEIINRYYSSPKDIEKVRLALFKMESAFQKAERMGAVLDNKSYGVFCYAPSVYRKPVYEWSDTDGKRMSYLGSVLLEREDWKFTGNHVTDIAYRLNIWKEWVMGFAEGFSGNPLKLPERLFHSLLQKRWNRNFNCGYDLGLLYRKERVLRQSDIDSKWEHIQKTP